MLTAMTGMADRSCDPQALEDERPVVHALFIVCSLQHQAAGHSA